MTVDEIKKEAIKAARKVTREDLEEATNFFKEEQTAQEMFEKLGYEKEMIWDDCPRYTNNKLETSIMFHCGDDTNPLKEIDISATGHTYQNSGMIGVEELKAINQQCKELGWM